MTALAASAPPPLAQVGEWSPSPASWGGQGEETFGTNAARLAGFCAVVLGWAPDQFWRATPAEVRGVVDALAPPGAAPVTRAILAEMEKADG